jgi:hypothetical protein
MAFHILPLNRELAEGCNDRTAVVACPLMSGPDPSAITKSEFHTYGTFGCIHSARYTLSFPII